MIVFVVPAVLAGLLGLVANGAEGAEAYIPKLRLLFLGAASLGYLGLAAFVWLKTRGWRRWGALVVGLAAVRVAYLPVVATALVFTGWLDWLGRMFGAEKLAAPVHYALACFVAALAGLVALAAVAACSRIKSIGSIVVLLCFVGLGVLAFWYPEDRVSPHPFVKSPLAPTSKGPEYLDVVEDRKRTPVTRILAAGGGIRHAMMARRGWGAVIRAQLLDRYRMNPDLTLGERIACLEAALLYARPTLTPPKPEPEPD